MIADSVIDVMLGEAGGRTPAERYADMLAIASVIQNRADKLGVPPQDVVSVKSEFNAYGKALPPGTESLRAIAEQAWNDVQTHGPIHNGTFMAKGSAVDNLPDGLVEVETQGNHRFFADPQNRSIRTAQGFVTPDYVPQPVSTPAQTAIESALTPAPPALPPTAPIPNAPPVAPVEGRTITPGIGLENLTPNARGTPVSAYDTSALAPSTRGLVEALGLSGFGHVGVNSGYRSPSRNARAGGASRSQHLTGRAIDLATAQMPEAQRAALLEAGIVKGNAKGIGLYPSGNIHMDTRTTPTVWGPGRSAYAGVGIDQVPAYAQPIISDMLNAGPYGVTPRTAPPVPTSRPEMYAAPAGVVERSPLASLEDQARIDAYGAYGASRRAALNTLPASAPVPSARPAVDTMTVQAIPTPTPAPRAVPSMADNTPIAPGFPPAPGFPEAPRSPEAQRNRDMAIGGLGGLAKGGIPGAIIGAVAAPAVAQIRGNIRSNRVAPPGGRQNILNGVRQAYNPMAAYGGPGMLGRLGGLLSTPDFTTPGYNTGSGYDAISSVFGAPAGAMAYSRSDPNVGWRSLGNGMAMRTNSKYGTSRFERAEDYGGRGKSGNGATLGGFFSSLFGGKESSSSKSSSRK